MPRGWGRVRELDAHRLLVFIVVHVVSIEPQINGVPFVLLGLHMAYNEGRIGRLPLLLAVPYVTEFTVMQVRRSPPTPAFAAPIAHEAPYDSWRIASPRRCGHRPITGGFRTCSGS